MRIFRCLGFALIGFIFLLSYSSYADIKDQYTNATTIEKAIAKAKEESKNVIVYFSMSRDSAISYDYDKILFSYPDFIEVLKEFVLVRDWATTQYAKSKKYKNIAQAVGQAQQLYFALIDPKDESNIKHVSILSNSSFPFTSEGDIVRELIRFTKGDKDAEKYTPSPTNAEKLNNVKGLYTELAGSIDNLSVEEFNNKFKKIEEILPGTAMAGTLKSYFDRKNDEKTRAEACQIKQESQDKVAICFDEYTYLRELGKWNRKTIYPVLYWHPYLTMNFIREFEPMEIEFIPPEPREEVDESLIYDAILASLSEKEMDDYKKSKAKDLKELYEEKNHKPRGVVLLNLKSPEYLGGVALACARTQWVEMLDSGSNQETRTDAAGVEKIRKQLMSQLDESGFAYKGFGDIDYITMAANIPYNYEYGLAIAGSNYVTDDAIARLDNDIRYAFVGRLMYGAGVATYQAMCSIFLKPDATLYFSRYADSGIWKQYWPDKVAADMEAETVYHPKATLEKFNEIMKMGNEYNFVYINSSGGARNWSTSKGGGTHENIPFSVPCTVHMTHSGTYGAPFDVDSIAVRWILGGAYCYLGSHSEPYLDAFVPPNTSIRRALEGLPLGETFRWTSPNQRWRPWKLAYVGDPMYSIAETDPERTEPSEIPRKHTLDDVFKNAYKDIKKAKDDDMARVLGQTLALTLMRDKASDLKKVFKSINRKNMDEAVLNALVTEILGYILHNLDLENFEAFEFLQFPKTFNKMNNWMFDRICVRLQTHLEEAKLSDIIKFIKFLSEVELPDKQYGFVILLLKSLALNDDFLENVEMKREKVIDEFKKAPVRDSRLSKMIEKELTK